MNQKNEAIRLAVSVAESEVHASQRLRAAGKSYNRFNIEHLPVLIAALRPLLDQTSDGVGDLPTCPFCDGYPHEYKKHDLVECNTGACPIFAKSMTRMEWSTRALTQADQPADKDDRQDLLDEIDRTLDYFRDEFPGEKDVWADPISAYAGGISANDLLEIKRALSGSDGRE